jgi:GTP-binding protein YchF
MALSIGIVGLPNVGKSTLFNALVKEAQAAAENFPFCTIEPNVGIVPVPDDRLQKLADIVKTEKIIPATVRFVDIAGLVAGAHKGEGLGNQFLAHIRETDAIAMVVRCFKNENVLHVAGKVNPTEDIKTIRLELILADMQTVEKMIASVERDKKSGNKEALTHHSALSKIHKDLNDEKLAMYTVMTDAEKESVKYIQLLTQKPILYIGNVAEEDLSRDPADFGLPSDAILICAKTEAELATLDEDEQKEYLTSLGLNESGLIRLVHQAFQTLGLEYYFTAGVQEVRAWTIHKGWTAPQAAGVIHTDFEKGFIRAEVMSYHDLVEFGSEIKVKEAGRLRVEGKEYIVKDGDILHYRFSG